MCVGGMLTVITFLSARGTITEGVTTAPEKSAVEYNLLTSLIRLADVSSSLQEAGVALVEALITEYAIAGRERHIRIGDGTREARNRSSLYIEHTAGARTQPCRPAHQSGKPGKPQSKVNVKSVRKWCQTRHYDISTGSAGPLHIAGSQLSDRPTDQQCPILELPKSSWFVLGILDFHV